MHWIRGQLEAFSYQHHFHVAAASFVGDGKKENHHTRKKKKSKLKKITSDLAGFTHFPTNPGKGHHCSAVTFDQKSKGWVLEKEKNPTS